MITTSLKSFFVKIAAIWFWFKEITVGDDILEWGYVYYKTPVGSEREKLAFRRTTELMAKHKWGKFLNDIAKAYPDRSPPNMLRKYAFGKIYVCQHNVFTELFRSALCNGKILDSAKEEARLFNEKGYWWTEFLLSTPNSEKEDAALKELKRLGEVFSSMTIGNYSIAIE